MTEEVKKTSYKPLWILIALCAFPYIAGTVYYQYQDELPQKDTVNYGTLVTPVKELKAVTFNLTSGAEKTIHEYRKKWLMLYVLNERCTEDCQKNIYFMRQVRKAMADDRYRIQRLLVLDDAALLDDQLQIFLQDYEGMDTATINMDSKVKFYSTIQQDSGNIFGKIMLVDPLGNLMMEYPMQPDPKRVLKDIQRLLKISRIG